MTKKVQKTRSIATSRLRLKDYWVDELSVISNDEWAKKTVGLEAQAKYVVERLASEDDDEVIIRLELSSPRTAKASRPHTFKLVMHGVFELPNSSDSNEKSKSLNAHLTKYNTVAVLYGVARGILANSSALTQNGAVQLPTANFIASEDD